MSASGAFVTEARLSGFNYGWIAIFETVILIFLFRLKKKVKRGEKIFSNQIKLNDAIHQVLY